MRQRGAVALGDLVRDRAELYRRHARDRAGAEDAEPFHALDSHVTRAADGRARADRKDERLRKRAAHHLEQPGSGSTWSTTGISASMSE